jgi:hypothetical protein
MQPASARHRAVKTRPDRCPVLHQGTESCPRP